MNPLAVELNEQIEKASADVLALLSDRGRAIEADAVAAPAVTVTPQPTKPTRIRCAERLACSGTAH